MKRILIILIAIMSAVSPAIARQPQKGYRGFIDWSNSYRTEASIPGFSRTSSFHSGLSTTHGYQINPIFFAGAGLDLEPFTNYGGTFLSVFAEGRADLKLGNFTPFADVRLGYCCDDGGGVYFSPTIGYRFNWGRKVGINLALGMSLNGYTRDMYEINFYDYSDNYYDYSINYIGKHRGADPYFVFRVGFDF